MTHRSQALRGSNAIGTLSAITFGLLMLGAGLVGALHYHHEGGATDSACAVCVAGANTAATTLAVVAPAAPRLASEFVAHVAETGPVSATPRRASSRAPPRA